MKIRVLLQLLLLIPLLSAAQHKAPELNFRVPKSLKAGELYSVQLKLARNDNTGGCLIEMEFPFGYIINEQQSEDALFSFSDSKLEYQWLVLPTKDTLNIEFAVLIPDKAQSINSISGTLTYTLNDVRIEHPINPLQLIIQAETPVQLAKTVRSNKQEENIIEAQTHIPVKAEVERELIRFRLQLGAFKAQVNKESIASQFGIPSSEIVEFKHQGMFKYAFGNYANPSEARNSMLKYPKLKDKTFVIGFKNGQRIELDEAIEGSKEDSE